MSNALLKYETIDRNQIDDIMAGKEPREPKGWADIGKDDSDKPSSDNKESVVNKADSADKKNKSDSDENIGDAAEQH